MAPIRLPIRRCGRLTSTITNREDNGIVKLDYHLNDRNTFSGRFFVGDSLQTEEDSQCFAADLPVECEHARGSRRRVVGVDADRTRS